MKRLIESEDFSSLEQIQPVQKHPRQNCPLCCACFNGKIECVRYLLAVQYICQHNVAKSAAAGGHIEIVQLLLQENFDFSQTLKTIISHGHDSLFILLIGELEFTGNIHYACLAAKGGNVNLFKMLLDMDLNISINEHDENNKTPVEIAVENNNSEFLSYLLTFPEIEVNRDLLCLAARLCLPQIVRILVDSGISFNPAIDAALLTKNTEIISLILKITNNVSGVLISAVKYNDPNIVQIVLADDRINVNEKNEIGQTPIHLAAQNGNEEIVRILLDVKGINTKVIDQRVYISLNHKKFIIIIITNSNSNCY